MANRFSFPPPPPPPPPSHQQQDLSQHRSTTTTHQQSSWQHRLLGENTHSRGRGHNPGGRYAGATLPRGSRSHQAQAIHAHHESSAQSGRQSDLNYGTNERLREETHGRVSSHQPPTRSHAGHKRKLDALRERHPAPDNRKGPETAPSVPRFGAAIVTAPSTRSNRNEPVQPAQQSKSSLFGLKQSSSSHNNLSDTESDHEDDEQEDIDEEATYAQLGTKLVFEYEGIVVKLDSEADLAKWHAERKQKWPSSVRIAEAQAARQKTGAERRRLLEAAYGLRDPGFKFRLPRQWQPQPYQDANGSNQSVQIDRGFKSEPEVSSQPPSAETVGLPGMAMYDSEDQSDGHTETTATATPLAQVNVDVHPDDDDDDDNDPPEQTSSKEPCASSFDQRACKYFFYYGKCKEGDRCSYRHDAQSDRPLVHVPAAQKRGHLARARKSKQAQGRKGIHQLLVDQESEAADRLALQVIKHLGGIGFFKEE